MVSTGSDRTLSLSLPEDNEVIKPQRWREEEDDGEHNLVTVRWGGERCSLFLILRQHDPVGRTVARIGSCHHVLLSLDYKYPQLSHGRSAPPHLASSWSRYCPSLSVLYFTVLYCTLLYCTVLYLEELQVERCEMETWLVADLITSCGGWGWLLLPGLSPGGQTSALTSPSCSEDVNCWYFYMMYIKYNVYYFYPVQIRLKTRFNM